MAASVTVYANDCELRTPERAMNLLPLQLDASERRAALRLSMSLERLDRS